MTAPDKAPAIRAQPAAKERYDQLAQTFARRRGVTREGSGFGSGALKVRGRIFASISTSGQFIVKLPRTRVDALVEAGHGLRFDPGHGRLMRQWLAVGPDSTVDWLQLADEALEYALSSATPSPPAG